MTLETPVVVNLIIASSQDFIVFDARNAMIFDLVSKYLQTNDRFIPGLKIDKKLLHILDPILYYFPQSKIFPNYSTGQKYREFFESLKPGKSIAIKFNIDLTSIYEFYAPLREVARLMNQGYTYQAAVGILQERQRKLQAEQEKKNQATGGPEKNN